MKIVFTGGGSGGHFYPIISVAQEIQRLVKEEKLIDPELYFLAPHPYDRGMLFDYGINYKMILSGKRRLYKSIWNFVDHVKLVIGIFQAIWTVFWIYPDVIFSKGGFGSVPVVLAGKLFGIPIIIHETDSVPGRANAWAGKFAAKIAISFPDAAEHFNKNKVAWTGSPIRDQIKVPALEGGHEYLKFDKNIETILIIGGSQGAEIINNVVLDCLPQLVEKYQVIHQTGKNGYKTVKETSNLILKDSPHVDRYKVFQYLNDVAMRMSAGACDIVISRAGSTIFEIALWGKPSILIPITESNGNHQRKNAYNYLRSGACVVVEENNLTPEILLSELQRLFDNPGLLEGMSASAKEFAKPDAGKLIARQIIDTLIKHES